MSVEELHSRFKKLAVELYSDEFTKCAGAVSNRHSGTSVIRKESRHETQTNDFSVVLCGLSLRRVAWVIIFVCRGAVFQWCGVTPPNHPGYVQFPPPPDSFCLDVPGHRQESSQEPDLIPYGILLKISYCSVVLFHWLTTGVPGMWKPFCIFDLVFLVLFIWAYTALRRIRSRASKAPAQRRGIGFSL